MLKLGLGGGKIGPWRAQITRNADCEVWHKADTDADDWKLNMARACSMMGLCFGGIFALFFFFNQCLFPLPCGQKLMDVSSTGIQISLSLVWAITWSDVCDDLGGCSWGDGATALIITQAMYFGAGIFSRCMREPRYKRRAERGDDDDGYADPPPPKKKKKSRKQQAEPEEEGMEIPDYEAQNAVDDNIASNPPSSGRGWTSY